MEEKEFNYINVIPFIDIMLVLLTVVLTSSTFIAQGTIPLDLPRVANSQSETLKTLAIEIDRTGGIFMNASPLPLHDLKGYIGQYNRETPVLVRADRELRLQVFVDVIDIVKDTGFRNISLQTEVKR